jgi:hypothetical protein
MDRATAVPVAASGDIEAKSRIMQTYSPVAQSVEHLTVNRQGSRGVLT